jgi:hypothetical protein
LQHDRQHGLHVGRGNPSQAQIADREAHKGGRDMTGLEALQAVQFVTVRGRRLAVLNAEDWEAMVEWLETLEDVSLAKEAQRALHAVGNDRDAAGWLRWDDVKKELE